MTTRTRTLAALAALVILTTGCSRGPSDEEKAREEAEQAATAAAVCRTEGGTYTTAILAYLTEHGDNPTDLRALVDSGLLTRHDPHYWDYHDGDLVGLDADDLDNTDRTCGGTVAPPELP